METTQTFISFQIFSNSKMLLFDLFLVLLGLSDFAGAAVIKRSPIDPKNGPQCVFGAALGAKLAKKIGIPIGTLITLPVPGATKIYKAFLAKSLPPIVAKSLVKLCVPLKLTGR